MIKKLYLFLLFLTLSGAFFACVSPETTHVPFFKAPSPTLKEVRVSIKQVNPWDKDYYLWKSFLGAKNTKQLTWKEAGELSPRQLFFVKGGFSLEEKKYLGKLFLEKDYKGKLRLINEIDIETYLKSVVPSEMIYSWPEEALKAQAIVSRTYASYDFSHSTGFLESSVLDQVYGGQKNRRPTTDHAVEATQGKVLTYKGKIFPAYFHSASGGETTTVPYVWPTRENFGVIEQVEDEYSTKTPHQNWKSELSPGQITKLLEKKNEKLGFVTSLQVLDRDPSGRVTKIKVVGQKNSKIYTGNEFRLMVGWKNLKSTQFKLKKTSEKFVFEGRGFGHGVGFSQWGAKAMAEKGYNYKQILKHYFPKAKITR